MKEKEIPRIPEPECAVTVPSSDASSVSCLNSRGQMRWSPAAVHHLLTAHQGAVAAKSRAPSEKLAELLHREFLRVYPACPVSPTVLLTKCYIFRSEIKSGKLVLDSSASTAADGTGVDAATATIPGLSRKWTAAMLAELEPARQRALAKKRQLGPDCAVAMGDFWLGEFRVRFPEYRGSKKQLLKQYRRLKSVSEQGGESIEISNETYEEVKAILESRQVLLPPFVSNKVIMRAQQWVEQAAQQLLGSEDLAGEPGQTASAFGVKGVAKAEDGSTCLPITAGVLGTTAVNGAAAVEGAADMVRPAAVLGTNYVEEGVAAAEEAAAAATECRTAVIMGGAAVNGRTAVIMDGAAVDGMPVSVLPGGALLISGRRPPDAPVIRLAEAPDVSIIPSVPTSAPQPVMTNSPPRAVIVKLSEIGEFV